MTGSSNTRSTLQVGSRSYDYWSFAKLPADKVARLPFSLKILLENLLRYEDGVNVTARRHPGGARLGRQGHALLRNRLHARARDHAGLHRRALRGGPRRHARSREEARRRSAADQPAESRRAGHRPLGAGGRLRPAPARSRPTTRSSSSATASVTRSCAGARPRSDNFKVVPPNTGIVHQVNLEYLGRVVFHNDTERQERRPIPTPWSAPTRTPP